MNKIENNKPINENINNNENKKAEIKITHNYKDVGHKYLTKLFKERALNAYGFDVPEVEELCPTELPLVEANELRIDNLLKFKDGTYGIIDYECQYKKADKYKYYNYIVRVATSYYNDNKEDIRLRMLVLYSADVKEENLVSQLDIGASKLTIEPIILKDIDVNKRYKELECKIKNDIKLSEEDIVNAVVLPLCCRDIADRRELMDKLIKLVKLIQDKEQQCIVAKGLITFTDKFIDSMQIERLKGLIEMTKIDQLYYEEALEMVNKAVEEKTKEVTTKTVTEMIKDGLANEKIAKYCSNITIEEIENLRASM